MNENTTIIKMILIADSGSTKTDWTVLEGDRVVKQMKTQGINPFYLTEDEIAEEIGRTLKPELPSTFVDDIFFYGAGCTPEKQPIVERALRRQFAVKGRIEVASDMLGAARAICGHKPGIACILGTGSNSCSYDGERIVDNVSPLGFILGDEGSGAVLGKMLVADVLKRQLPETIIRRFHNKYQLTAAEIIDRVYRQKLPNRFLASFVPFLSENIEEPSVRALVKSSFRLFIRRNVLQYKDADLLPIGFVGSVAFYFRTPLQEVMKEEGLHLGNIIQAPSEGLVRYHATSNN